MPTNKDLKRLTRSRMIKTGESYTAARAQLLEKQAAGQHSSNGRLSLADRAGMSDEAVRAKTGFDWNQWVRRLDAIDASSMDHPQIARYIGETFEVSGWWAQSVTVGYERIKGLREIGQRRAGTYDANKSKTFAVPVAQLYRAFRLVRTRGRWLPDVSLTVRTSTTNKSMRVLWDDATTVNIYFTAKGKNKSQVAIQHGKLRTKRDVETMKRFWGERLTALAELLALRK